MGKTLKKAKSYGLYFGLLKFFIPVVYQFDLCFGRVDNIGTPEEAVFFIIPFFYPLIYLYILIKRAHTDEF